MRVGMADAAGRQQAPGVAQRGDDRLVGVAFLALVRIDPLSGEQRHVAEIGAVGPDRLRHLDAVRLAQHEIVGAVARCDMHEARARIHRHEVADEDAYLEVVALAVQRVPADRADQILATESGHHLVRGDLRVAAEILDQRLGDQIDGADGRHRSLARLGHAQRDVRLLGRHRDGAVAGDGPGRRRPDDDRCVLGHALAGDDREGDVDRVRRVVVILDLGVGERRLLDHRPEDRPRAAIEAAVHGELADLARDLRLGLQRHGLVGVLPVADHAQALEFLRLDGDPLGGEVAAFLPELQDRHLVLVLAGGAILLLDLPLDRQAVAVPAGDVVRVLAQHLLGAVDDVLEDLVERVADMQVAVRIGRPVVQDELLAALRRLALQAIEVVARPPRQQVRLARRQVAPHRELGSRQEDGRLVVAAHVWRPSEPRNLGAGRETVKESGRKGVSACAAVEPSPSVMTMALRDTACHP